MLATAGDRTIESGDSLETFRQRATEKQQAGRIEEAQRRYREIAQGRPDQPGAWFLLGETARKAGDIADACQAFERAARLRPAHFQYQFHLGRARLSNGDYEDAARALDTACLLRPTSASARLYLALAHFATGAVQNAARAARHLPSLCIANALHSLRPRFREPRQVREAALELARRERARLNFAMGRIHLKAENHDRAFARFETANRLTDVTFSAQAWTAQIDRVIETFDAPFFRRFEGLGYPDARPLFVVGMPCSGTGAVGRIVAAHPKGAGAGELEEVNLIAAELGRQLDGAYPRQLERLNGAWTDRAAERYLARLSEAGADALRIADTMPANFLHLGLIACLFPRARIVNCRRDALDACLSIFCREMAGDHPYAYSLENLGFYYREYERLMDHWRRVLPLALLDVDYEALEADREGEARRLLAFCDLPWDARCLDAPANDGEAVGWSRQFARHLGPLKAALNGQGGGF